MLDIVSGLFLGWPETALPTVAAVIFLTSSLQIRLTGQSLGCNLAILRQAPEQSQTSQTRRGSQPRGGQRSDLGMSQTTITTSRNYRIMAILLAVLLPYALLYSPLLQPSGQAGDILLSLIGGVLSLLAVWHAVWVLSWRMSYDSIGLSHRNRLLQPEARMWRALTAISSDGPFITLFHFADGLVMRIPNFVTGRRQMMRTAQSWVNHERAPDRP